MKDCEQCPEYVPMAVPPPCKFEQECREKRMNIQLPFAFGDTIYFMGRFKAVDNAQIETVKIRRNSVVITAKTDNGFYVTFGVEAKGRTWWLDRSEAVAAVLAECPCEDKVSDEQCSGCFRDNLRKEAGQ